MFSPSKRKYSSRTTTATGIDSSNSRDGIDETSKRVSTSPSFRCEEDFKEVESDSGEHSFSNPVLASKYNSRKDTSPYLASNNRNNNNFISSKQTNNTLEDYRMLDDNKQDRTVTVNNENDPRNTNNTIITSPQKQNQSHKNKSFTQRVHESFSPTIQRFWKIGNTTAEERKNLHNGGHDDNDAASTTKNNVNNKPSSALTSPKPQKKKKNHLQAQNESQQNQTSSRFSSTRDVHGGAFIASSPQKRKRTIKKTSSNSNLNTGNSTTVSAAGGTTTMTTASRSVTRETSSTSGMKDGARRTASNVQHGLEGSKKSFDEKSECSSPVHKRLREHREDNGEKIPTSKGDEPFAMCYDDAHQEDDEIVVTRNGNSDTYDNKRSHDSHTSSSNSSCTSSRTAGVVTTSVPAPAPRAKQSMSSWTNTLFSPMLRFFNQGNTSTSSSNASSLLNLSNSSEMSSTLEGNYNNNNQNRGGGEEEKQQENQKEEREGKQCEDPSNINLNLTVSPNSSFSSASSVGGYEGKEDYHDHTANETSNKSGPSSSNKSGPSSEDEGKQSKQGAVRPQNYDESNNENQRPAVLQQQDEPSTISTINQQHQDDGVHAQEGDEYDEEEEEDEDAFDPYAFIKSLPPYEDVLREIGVREPRLPRMSRALRDRHTLVLDLDETLVHCSISPITDYDLTFPVMFGGVEYTVYVRKRPHLETFLKAVAELFEVCVFTASQEVYATALLDIIDTGKLIKHRLYRDACVNVDGNYLKDLNILGREMHRVMLVDNSPHAFGFQVENGIPIESWFDDKDDQELLKLLPLLNQLAKQDDVRPFKSTMATIASSSPRNIGIVLYQLNDLRVSDHPPLTEAHNSCDEVVHLFCFDSSTFNSSGKAYVDYKSSKNSLPLTRMPKCGFFRSNFILEAVEDLKQSLKSLSGNKNELIVYHGQPEDMVDKVVKTISNGGNTGQQQPNNQQGSLNNSTKFTIFAHRPLSSEEENVFKRIDEKVNSTKSSKIDFNREGAGLLNGNPLAFRFFWGGATLFHLTDLQDFVHFTHAHFPITFTQFRKICEKDVGSRSIREPYRLPKHWKASPSSIKGNQDTFSTNLPPLDSLLDTAWWPQRVREHSHQEGNVDSSTDQQEQGSTLSNEDDAYSETKSRSTNNMKKKGTSTSFSVHDKRSAIRFHRGGEKAAHDHLERYVWGLDLLKSYKETRNGMVGVNYSSKMSPYLAHGNITARQIFFEVQKYEQQRVANKSTYWLIFELLWRDFMRFYALAHGNRIYHLWGPKGRLERHEKSQVSHYGRPNDAPTVWKQDLGLLSLWTQGKTGNPFIDACMIELRETGFMSNRGRQCVASYLVHDLQLDWRLGAMWFETMLIDHDPCQNYGNWTYAAGVGADPREGRYFNSRTQMTRYDKDGKFVKLWIPLLKHVPVKELAGCESLPVSYAPLKIHPKWMREKWGKRGGNNGNNSRGGRKNFKKKKRGGGGNKRQSSILSFVQSKS
eukprot:g1522.t1